MYEKLIIQFFSESEMDEIINDIRNDKKISLLFLNNMFLIFLEYLIGTAILSFIFFILNNKILFYTCIIYLLFSVFFLITIRYLMVYKVPKYLIKRHLDLCKEIYITDDFIKIKNTKIKINSLHIYLTEHPKYTFILCNPTKIIPSVIILKKDSLSVEFHEELIKRLAENRKRNRGKNYLPKYK